MSSFIKIDSIVNKSDNKNDLIVYLDNESKFENKFKKFNMKVLAVFELDGKKLGKEITLDEKSILALG